MRGGVFLSVVLLLLVVACEYKTIVSEEIASGEVLSFKTHVVPVFQQHCISCHANAAFPPILLKEVAYDELLSGNYLIAGQPQESVLILKINEQHPNAWVLTATEKERIRLWIEQGAKDN